MRKFLYIIIASICLGSCVYPYDDLVVTDVDNLVIEGDIVIGGVSYFLPTRLMSLNDPDHYLIVHSTIWVESGDGKTYPATYKDDTYGYEVDLKAADPSREYRLRLETPDGKQYASQWGKVEGSVEVDGLKYQMDIEKNVLNIKLDLHSNGESRHFRYRYFEDWEYKSHARAYVYYDPDTDSVKRFDGTFNTYYCWRTGMSRGLNLATTEKMTEDVLDDYTFKTIPNTDERLSIMYKIRLEVYPVSPESYAYYENVRDISSPTGDLFSPMPSEVRGNIRNMSDESEMVYGYVAVVRPSSATLYYDNEIGMFYHNIEHVEYEEEIVPQDQFRRYYYSKNYRPVQDDPAQGVSWGPARCIDCRLLGGTKNRPEGWPKADY